MPTTGGNVSHQKDKSMLNSLTSSIKNQMKSRYDAFNANFFGLTPNIGEFDVFEILNKAESLDTDFEQGYSEQKGIGQKPTIVASGETLKRYSIPITLHISYCNPDDIIEKLEEKVQSREIFSWYRGDIYMGEFVVNKVHKTIEDVMDNHTIYAKITVDLLEYYDDTKEEEFEQQTLKSVSIDKNAVLTETVSSYKSPVEVVKQEVDNIYAKLTDKVINDSMRTAESTIGSFIGGLY